MYARSSVLILPLALGALALTACKSDFDLNTDVPHVDDPDTGVPYDAGGVHGRVCAPDQQTWVSGADVWIDHAEGKSLTATDGDGYFTLTGVPPGIYTINVQKGSFSTTLEAVEIVMNEITELGEPTCIEDKDVRIAVVTGIFDSIEHVLDRLGISYTLIDGTYGTQAETLLGDPSALSQYDIIFFNCGMNDGWLYNQANVGKNLRDYVHNGGSLYASDWAYYLVEASFPDMIDFIGEDYYAGAAYVGESAMVTATVKDPAIASALGSTSAQINYDLGMWASIEAVGDPSYTMLQGSFSWSDGWNTGYHTGPLAAKMTYGTGTVLYTSFHNEQQSTADMDVILQEIIFHL